MEPRVWVEIIGYVGSGLVLISMLMSSVVRLRVINMIGSVIFTVYALLIRSYPTALMNACLVGINIYHLLRLRKPAKSFAVCEDRADSAWVAYLLAHYREDIAKHFPDFRAESLRADSTRVFLVTRESETVGLLIGEPEGDTLRVLLDYATPVYRDCSVGEALYPALPEHGIRALVLQSVPEHHRPYTDRMGFVLQPDGSAVMKL